MVLLLGGGAAILLVDYWGPHERFIELNEIDPSHAITQEQFDSIELGTPMQAVIDTLGAQPLETQRFGTRPTSNVMPSTCLFYNRSGGEFLDVFTFCFDGTEILASKHAYE